jgi:hypothetical protein
VVIPNDLVHLLPVIVELDELDHGRCRQLSPPKLLSNAKDTEIGEILALSQKIMVQQLVRRLLLH